MADDYSSDTGTTGAVTVGGSATGDIETAGDRDWFAVTFKAGRIYRIDLEGHDTGGGALAVPQYLGLYKRNGDFTTVRDMTIQPGGCYQAEADVTYYLEVGGRGGGTGGYRLSVAEVPDDFAAGTKTTGAVAVGGSATGELEHGRDRDWFEVVLEAGRTYRIDLKGSATDDGTLADPNLAGVYDASGKLIDDTWDEDSGTGRNSSAVFTPEKGGTYYIETDASTDYSVDISPWLGTYTLSVVEENAAGTGTTGRVEVGGSVRGEIEVVGNHDWFAVTLEAGRSYRIDLKGKRTGDGTLRDPYLAGIHDAEGVYVGGADDNGGKGRNSRQVFTPEEDGVYYVAAGAADGHTGTYTLSVAEVPNEIAAGTGTTGVVAVGGSAASEIDWTDDRDWFAVTLEAGRSYRIELKGKSTGDGTLRNPYLNGVYDAQGVYVGGWDDDGGEGRNSRVVFTPDEAGVYHVAAGGAGDTGTYTLSVAEVPNDIVAGTGTTGVVAVGGSAAGEIEFRTDRDWFAVTLEAGRTYRIDLKGQDTGDGTLRDPYLDGIHNAQGAFVGGVDDNGGEGRNSRQVFTPEEDGVYYVAAGAVDSHSGTYTVSVADVSDKYDHSAGTGTTGAVAVGGSAAGEIGKAGDNDWFAVTLEAGRSYRIDLKGKRTGDGTLGDPHLDGIYDAQGVYVGGWDDNGGKGRNSRQVFTPDEAGVYYVAAGAVDGHTGTYTLSVAEVVNDIVAGTGTTGAVAVGGSVAGEIEKAGDSDWFAVTLEAGRSYRIDLKGKRTGDGSLRDPYLDGIYDAEGAYVGGGDDNGGEGRNSCQIFMPDEAGVYYVAAGAVDSHSGTYTVSVADVSDKYDHSAGTGTTGAVAVGGSAAGEIEKAGDSDWFAVTLEAGRSYRIDLKGKRTGDGTLGDPHLDGIFDAQGASVGDQDDNGGEGRNSRQVFTPDEAGVYYVAAGAVDGHTGTYTLSIAEEIAAGTDTTGVVAVGGSAAGEIEFRTDRDWFAVTLETGRSYLIDLKGQDTGDGTLQDPYLDGIYDAQGAYVGGADDNGGTGRNSRGIFAPEEDGVYYLGAGTVDDHTGTYTLSVAEEIAGGTDTTGVVAVGGSAAGEIEFRADRDWFAVTLQAGRSYRIDLKGQDTGDGTLQDPYLAGIYDAQGAYVRGADDNGGTGRNSRQVFTPEEDDVYYLAADAVGDHTGTYTLSVEDFM